MPESTNDLRALRHDPASDTEGIVMSAYNRRAEQGVSYDQATREVQATFGTEQAPQQAAYDQARMQAQAGQRYQNWTPSTGEVFGSSSIPFLSTFQQATAPIHVYNASQRVRRGGGTQADFDLLARHQRQQQLQQSLQEGAGQGDVRDLAILGFQGLAGVPAMAGEAYAGGSAVRALGGGAALAGSASARVAGLGLRTGATAALTPSMYLPQWQQRNLEEGRRPSDLSTLPSAYGMGVLNTAVLGSLGPLGDRITTAGVRGIAARLITRTTAGMIEQQGADIMASAVSEVLPRAYRLETGYGVMGSALRGEWGGAMQHVVTQAVTFAAFSAFHEAQHGPQASAPGEPVTAAATAINRLSRAGLTREAAGNALAEAASPVQAALAGNPNLSRREARRIVLEQGLPDGPVREYALSLAESLPFRPEPPPAERPRTSLEQNALSYAEASQGAALEQGPPRGAPIDRASSRRIESPMTPEQANAALAAEQAKGPSRNRVEPRTRPAEPAAPPEPAGKEPLAAWPDQDVRYLARSMGLASTGSRAELMARMRQSFGPSADVTLRAIEAAEQKTASPQVIRPLERPPEAPPGPAAAETPVASPEAAGGPPAQAQGPPRPENAWHNTGTVFREHPEGLQFTGRNGENYLVREQFIKPGERESSPNGGVIVRIFDKTGGEVGHVGFFRTETPGVWQGEGLHVEQRARDSKERRTGVSAAMYDYIAHQGEHVVPAGGQTAEGKRFWDRNRQMRAEAEQPRPLPSSSPANLPTAIERMRQRQAQLGNVPTPQQPASEPRAPAASGEAVPPTVEQSPAPKQLPEAERQAVIDALVREQRREARSEDVGGKTRAGRRQETDLVIPQELQRRIDEAPLSSPEKNVLRMRLNGDSLRVIGGRVGMSPEGVRKAVDRIEDKLMQHDPATWKDGIEAAVNRVQEANRQLFQDRARSESPAAEPVIDAATEHELANIHEFATNPTPGTPEALAAVEAEARAVQQQLQELENALLRTGAARGENPASVRRAIDAIQGEVHAAVGAVDPRQGNAAAGNNPQGAGPAEVPGAGATAERPANAPAAAGRDAASGNVLTGKPTRVVVQGGKPVPARYEVREMDDVRASDQVLPGGGFRSRVKAGEYPGGLQPRDYTNPAERQKVFTGAGQMIPEYFISNHPDASNGPPTIAENGIVINGNGRQMMLEASRNTKTYDGYKQALVESAQGFGLDPQAVARMKHPVLYRVVSMSPTGAEAHAFAAAGNVSTTQAQSPLRSAASLARLVTPEVINSLRLEGDTTFSEAVNDPTAGRSFRELLASQLPAAERERYFGRGNMLTEAGKELVRDMLLSRVMPAELIEQLQGRALKRTMEAAIPQLLELKRDYPTSDISPQLEEAIRFNARNPDARTDAEIKKVLGQASLFGGKVDELSPGGRMMLDFIIRDGGKSSEFRKKLTAFIQDMSGSVGLFSHDIPEPAKAAAAALGVKEQPGATFGAPTARASSSGAFPAAPSEGEQQASLFGGGQPQAGEAARLPSRDTALANAQVDLERKAHALPELPGENPVSDERLRHQAVAVLTADPGAGQKLLTDLGGSPRPPDALETMVLLHQRAADKVRHGRLVLEYLAEAAKDRAGGKADTDVLAWIDTQERALLAQIDLADRITSRAGTEAGRAFRLRRVLMAEDYSLSGMLQGAERAKGSPLTQEERSTVADLQKQIADLQKQLAGMEDTGKLKPGAPSEEGFRLTQLKAEYDSHVETWRYNGAPLHIKALRLLGEAFAIPREIMSAIDFPLLRQGLVAALTHPVRTAKAVPEMFRAFASEEAAQRAQYELDHRDNAPLYRAYGLDLSRREGPLAAREEGFLSRLITKVPGLGALTKASERSYQTVLNRIRADSFDAMASALSRDGGKMTPGEGMVIANYVNVMTGRGPLGAAAKAGNLLSQVFFAPRWTLSRFQLLLGQPLFAHFEQNAPRARQLVAQEYGRLAAGFGMAAGLAVLAGFNLETDPRSPNFGKLKVGGGTFLEMTGGLAQAARLVAQTLTLSTKNQWGKVSPLSGQVPFGQDNYSDVFWRFLRGHLAPAPGAALNLLSGTDVTGQPATALSTAGNLAMPLYARDVMDAFKDLGVPQATAASLAALFGLGMQTHQPRHGGREADEVLGQLSALEAERNDVRRRGLVYRQESQYQMLHQAAAQIRDLEHRMAGQHQEGRRQVPGQEPSAALVQQLRERQRQVAASALSRLNRRP